MYVFEKIKDEDIAKEQELEKQKKYEIEFEQKWEEEFGSSDEERIMSADDTLKELKRMALFNV